MVKAQQIVMHFAKPPGLDDLHIIAGEIIETFPDELIEHTNKLVIELEDFPDEATEQEQNLEDPFDLPCLFRSGKELYPGVERKDTKGGHVLVLFRRPLLDMWCEQGDDLFILLRQLMIEEISRAFDFSDEDIAEMVNRHHQHLL